MKIDYKDKRMKAPPSRLRRVMWAVAVIATVTVVVVTVHTVRRELREYRVLVASLQGCTDRNTFLEQQLSAMVKSGDQGVLVANIGRDLIGWQLRLVPRTP